MSQFIEMFGGDKWIKKCLGEVGTFKRGGGFQKSDYVEHGIPCIHYGQIHTKFGPFISSHITEISLDLEVKTKFASKGDLIIAITSEDAEGSCKSTAWLGDYPVAVGGHAAIFNHSMNPLYMTYFFKSAMFNHAKMEYVHGTKVVEMRPDDIAKISIPYPPMSLQEQFSAIAQQADKSGFDGRKSQFIEMFGGGNWPQKTLGEVGSFTRGGGFLKSDFVEHGIPCIHYGQIHTKFGPFITSHITEISSDLESKTKFASKGDLVIAITSEDTEGSCKSTAWLGDYPVAVGGHAAIYKHSMNPLYMSFFFKSTLFNYAKIEYVHGTKVFEIKPDDIAKILVPCPPMSLQNQFSAIAVQSDKSGSVLLKLSSR